MKLKRIQAKDFLTYEELNYNFIDKTLMVQGLNLTDDNQKSNGSGKSSIQSMLEFCLTGDNSKGVRDRELVRFGKKESFLDLFIECETRKEKLHISWVIKVKGSNQLSLHITKDKENWEEVSFSNVNDGKKYIEGWIGISKKDLFNYFIINKSRFKSFFKSSNKEKVELINRFSDASIIDNIEEVDKTPIEEKYNDLRDSIINSEGKIQLLEENLIKESNRDLESEYKETKKEYKEANEGILEEISELSSDISSLNKNIKTLRFEIGSFLNSLEEELKNKLGIEKEIVEFNDSNKPLLKKLKNAQYLVDNFIEGDFSSEKLVYEKKIKEIEKNISLKKKDLVSSEKNKNKVLKVLNDIDIKLSGKIECPSCSHEFLPNSETPLEKLLKNKKKAELIENKLNSIIGNFNNDITSLKGSISIPELKIKTLNEKEKLGKSKYNELISSVNSINIRINKENNKLKVIELKMSTCNNSINSIKESISNKKIKISKLEQNISNIVSKISNYKKDIEANNNFIKSLSRENNENQIKSIKVSIEELRASKLNKELELKGLEDEIFKLDEWASNFKQFKIHIANLSLETMEYHCNRYLEGMGTDLRAKFDGYKVLANGTIRSEITAKVIRGEEREFGSFSGGEQGRLLFASILTNRHMINQTHPYGGLSFLSIDEIFEGVDSLGLQSLVEEASKLQECIMIISHVTDENIHCENLLIVKENGISKIK